MRPRSPTPSHSLQENSDDLRLGLVGGPQEGGQPRAVPCIRGCSEAEQDLTHPGLVTEHCVHERCTPSMVLVVHTELNSLGMCGVCVCERIINQ